MLDFVPSLDPSPSPIFAQEANMRSFLWSQILTYLVCVCPGAPAYRLILLGFWIGTSYARPAPALLAAVWQISTLYPEASLSMWPDFLQGHPANLLCDGRFWFICSSPLPSPVTTFLLGTKLGCGAAFLRTWVERFCLDWHPLWGNLAFSLLMGGTPDGRLKSLYRNLGFLHVLVISGSQFSLLSKWLRHLCRLPINLVYALALIDWRLFRPLVFCADCVTLLGLLVYLLACGASPPCQRAFLEQLYQFFKKWLWPPPVRPALFLGGRGSSGPWIFQAQALLFPSQWFSLSNLLSWGAVYSLKAFGRSRNYAAQLRVSISIQLLSLAVFSRLSLASLLFDFLVSPLWDILLIVCLLGIFLPELHLQNGMILALNFFHDGLYSLDRWQGLIFGSSSLSFRPLAASWGRLAAALLFVWLLLASQAGNDPARR